MNDRRLVFFPDVDEQYLTFTHESGLRVFFTKKDFCNTYAVLGVRFGAADEELPVNGAPLPGGCAHFLEHKLFENPDGEDSFLKFSRVGANANAYTTAERTCYLFSTVEEVSAALRVLLESVFTPYFTEENVKKEKGIIIEEINMYKDDPSDSLYCGLLRGLYPNSALSRNICGSVKSVRQMTPARLYEAYEHYYRPENMVLSVSGRCDPQEILRVLDDVLGTVLKGASQKDRPFKSLPSVKERSFVKRSVRLYRDVSTPMVGIGIRIPPFSGSPEDRMKRFAALCLLSHALFSGAGPFVDALKKKNLIPEDPSNEIVDRDRFSHILFFADCYDPRALFAEFDKHLLRIAKKGLEQREFLRCKRVLLAEHLASFDSCEDCASQRLDDALDGCDGIDYARIINDLDIDQVNDVAKKYFKKERICKCRLLPHKVQKEK